MPDATHFRVNGQPLIGAVERAEQSVPVDYLTIYPQVQSAAQQIVHAAIEGFPIGGKVVQRPWPEATSQIVNFEQRDHGTVVSTTVAVTGPQIEITRKMTARGFDGPVTSIQNAQFAPDGCSSTLQQRGVIVASDGVISSARGVYEDQTGHRFGSPQLGPTAVQPIAWAHELQSIAAHHADEPRHGKIRQWFERISGHKPAA